jgi:hypothetical protein
LTGNAAIKKTKTVAATVAATAMVAATAAAMVAATVATMVAATAAATVTADYKDKIAALTLTITGTKEKTLYFSSSDPILALFLSFSPFLFQSCFAFFLSCVAAALQCRGAMIRCSDRILTCAAEVSTKFQPNRTVYG